MMALGYEEVHHSKFVGVHRKKNAKLKLKMI